MPPVRRDPTSSRRTPEHIYRSRLFESWIPTCPSGETGTAADFELAGVFAGYRPSGGMRTWDGSAAARCAAVFQDRPPGWRWIHGCNVFPSGSTSDFFGKPGAYPLG